jgi:hypothetical protein
LPRKLTKVKFWGQDVLSPTSPAFQAEEEVVDLTQDQENPLGLNMEASTEFLDRPRDLAAAKAQISLPRQC